MSFICSLHDYQSLRFNTKGLVGGIKTEIGLALGFFGRNFFTDRWLLPP